MAQLQNLGWNSISYSMAHALYTPFQTYIFGVVPSILTRIRSRFRCSSKIQMWIHSLEVMTIPYGNDGSLDPGTYNLVTRSIGSNLYTPSRLPLGLCGPIPNHSGAASSRMLKVLPITVTPSWNKKHRSKSQKKQKKKKKWTGHCSFTTSTTKHYCMILSIWFCTTLTPYHSSLELHPCVSFTPSSAYNSSFCNSPEDDWPMAWGLGTR